MTRATKYVALDVPQATTVASVRAETGRVIARTIVPTEAHAVTECFRGMRGPVHVAFEEGTQAPWLHDLLTPRVQRVVGCDRHGEKRPGNTGDRVAADHLSARRWRGELRAVYHGSAHRATLQELTRAYRNLVEDTTRVLLRLKALFRTVRSDAIDAASALGRDVAFGAGRSPRPRPPRPGHRLRGTVSSSASARPQSAEALA